MFDHVKDNRGDIHAPNRRYQTGIISLEIYTRDTHSHTHIYIYIIVEKSPNSSPMYDHGFMDNTNRQAGCKSQKKSFK